jgi:hypothetical protein
MNKPTQALDGLIELQAVLKASADVGTSGWLSPRVDLL